MKTFTNEMIDLREILKHTPLDYFILIERKLVSSVPGVKFQVFNYEIRARGDRKNNSNLSKNG